MYKFPLHCLLLLISTIGAANDNKITVEELQKMMTAMTDSLMKNVRDVVDNSEIKNQAFFQNELERIRLEESENNKRNAQQLQEIIAAIPKNPIVPPDPIIPPKPETPSTTYIIPIFLKMMRCGNCFSCKQGEVCFYYVFIYVLPLIINPPANGGAANQNNALLESLMSSMSGQRVGMNQPGMNFGAQNLHQQPLANGKDPASSLIQSLFN